MKTTNVAPLESQLSKVTRKMAVLAGVVALIQSSHADIPDRPSDQPAGMYKVVSSNDPIFPLAPQQEWFLDFGDDPTSGKMSGNVAVSLRQNPSVRVRIMAWQYFPQQGNLLIGNLFHEGSKQAVERGNWQLRTATSGIIFERAGYQMVLHRADPADY